MACSSNLESSSPSSVDDTLSTFLETYPTKLHYRRPVRIFSTIWVFWSQNDEPPPNTSSSDDSQFPHPFHNKIRRALSDLDTFHTAYGLIQLWVPVEIDGRRLLTTSDQIFFLSDLESNLKEHRLFSLKHLYDIDVNNNEVEKKHVNNNEVEIISGAPSRAFLNRFPEIIPNLMVQQGCPLVRAALECGLTASFVLPIFSDSSQSCCIGVFEYYMKNNDDLIKTFRDLDRNLEKQGLYPFDAHAHISSKNFCGLEHAKNEIDKALEIFIDLHRIELVQVWIAYEDENHLVFSSSLDDDTQKKQMLGLRLTARCADDDYSDIYEWYMEDCCNIPLVNGKGLAERTLPNYEAHFHKNFSLNYDDDIYACSSCFAICLKNNETPHLLYVVEFLWAKHDHYIIMLEALFSTLQTRLPSFNFASGAKLGDELLVIDVDDSTGSGNGYFKILKGNTSSSIPSDASDKGKRTVTVIEESLIAKCKTAEKEIPLEKIKQQFGKTMKEAAKNLDVSVSTLKRKWKRHIDEARKKGHFVNVEWPGPNSVKRKVNDSKNNQSETNEEHNGAIEETSPGINRNENTLTIKAEYAGDMIKFRIPISLATIESVEEKIGKKLKLNPGTYKLKYLDEDGDLILLESDEDMKDCIKSFGPTLVRLTVITKI